MAPVPAEAAHHEVETIGPRSGSDPRAARAAERPLDLHEGICDPQLRSCRRWPEHLRILNEKTGELLPGRCRATNLCPYCARLFAVETSEMLLLDAMEDAPTLYVVLTAREHLTRADTYPHLRQLRRALRKTWPDVRWSVLVEYQKRGALHLNLLMKGVPADDLAELHEAVCSSWTSRVDATAAGQWSDVIADGIGVVQYVTLHFMKSSQAPAIGWRGHRYSSTRDYLVRPAAVMREEARRSLRGKRELWKLRQADPDATADELELLIADRLASADAATWRLVQALPLTADRPDSTLGQRIAPSLLRAS